MSAHRKMKGHERRVHRTDKREADKSLDRIEKQLVADLEAEQKMVPTMEQWSDGYQHGLKSALRLIDIERGREMRE